MKYDHSRRQPTQPGAQRLEEILQRQTDTLRDILEQVARELRSRKAISHRIVDDIGEDYRATRSELLALEAALIGTDARRTYRGHILETRLVALRQEQRLELAQRWRDQTRLTKELRAWIKEYHHDLRWKTLLTPHPQRHHNHHVTK